MVNHLVRQGSSTSSTALFHKKEKNKKISRIINLLNIKDQKLMKTEKENIEWFWFL